MLGLVACERGNQYAAPPPPVVTVAQALRQEVTDYLEFTGTTVASGYARVQARVSGVLREMHFVPGTRVKKGDLLFTIDPREYEAALQSAQAERASAQASFDRAKIELTRAQNLFERQAGSEAEVVKWRGEMRQATAAVKTAEARIARAELDLEYTQVQAPISGRVGRDQINVGNLVGEGEATVLTEITAYSPMFVYFNLNERDLLKVFEHERKSGRALRRLEDGADSWGEEARETLIMALANEEGFPHTGAVDFAESGVDPETGTMQLRGVFKNERGDPPALVPGLFARVRLITGTRPDVQLVTERALGNDQSGTFLMIVNSEGVVEKRNVVQGQLVEGLRVIEEGLAGDEWIVVKGVQRARPGLAVDAEKSDMAAFTVKALRAAAAKEGEAPARGDAEASEKGPPEAN